MQNLSYQEMVRAMRENNSGYDGVFYVGVISTGIFCLPSCRAKLPRLENVVFYKTRQEALAAGLRGCKRCRAANFPDVLPEWLGAVLEHMKRHGTDKLNERELTEIAGVDISTIRRNFKQYFQMTPTAIHRKMRLERARHLIKSGSNYLYAAFECGYDSSSGFRQAFSRQFGQTPGRIHDKK
jgi:AraC family transcriptional regulator of adaptative response/methylated-DNA-[protein]-cysteine methyltransferase